MRHNSRSSISLEQPWRRSVRELPGGVLLPQPTAEIAHARRGPDLAAGCLMAALDCVEQRSRKFGIRGKQCAAGLDGRHQTRICGFRAQFC